jgi:hypothetical protein
LVDEQSSKHCPVALPGGVTQSRCAPSGAAGQEGLLGVQLAVQNAPATSFASIKFAAWHVVPAPHLAPGVLQVV